MGRALVRCFASHKGRVEQEIPKVLGEWAARDAGVLPLLAPFLDSPDYQVRRSAAAALGSARDPAAVLALGKPLLADPNRTVRVAAVSALRRSFAASATGAPEDQSRHWADGIACALEPLLDDKDIWVVSEAHKALGRIDGARYVARAASFLASPRPEIRAAAAEALGSLRDLAWVPRIVALLGDPDVGVQCSALWALVEIDSPAAIPDVIRSLECGLKGMDQGKCLLLMRPDAEERLFGGGRDSNVKPKECRLPYHAAGALRTLTHGAWSGEGADPIRGAWDWWETRKADPAVGETHE